MSALRTAEPDQQVEISKDSLLLSFCLSAILVGGFMGGAAGWLLTDNALGIASHLASAFAYSSAGAILGLLAVGMLDVVLGGRLESAAAEELEEFIFDEENSEEPEQEKPREMKTARNSLLEKKVS